MKRSAMKSNLSVEQRHRCPTNSGGRLFPRRKVASKSIILNNGTTDFNFDKELSMAIQESLKYVAQDCQEKEEEFKDSSISKSEFITVKVEDKSRIIKISNNSNNHTNNRSNRSCSVSPSLRARSTNKSRSKPSSTNTMNCNSKVQESSSEMSDPSNGTEWASDEVSRLKDLLLTQTELIECQQEEIQRKDKEISDLMAGKNAVSE